VVPTDLHGAAVTSKHPVFARRVNIQAIVADHEKRVTVADEQIARLKTAALGVY